MNPATSVTALPLLSTYAAGFYKGLPSSIYHARELGLASKSVLDLVHRSPAHYKSWADGADGEETAALIFGSAFHCSLFEPERFKVDYASEPDWGDLRAVTGRTTTEQAKGNKDRRDEWRLKNPNTIPLSAADQRTITGMTESVRNHKMVRNMVRGGEPEMTLRWKDPETGLQCKSRTDYYVEELDMVVDIKTTMDATYEGFRKSIAKYRYYVQDAMYRKGFSALGKPLKHFIFVACEKTPPFALALFQLDIDGVELGHAHASKDMNKLAACLATNDWPGYAMGIQKVELPPWIGKE